LSPGQHALLFEAEGGNTQEQQTPKVSRKVPKLAKKNKSRLPRREKKARQKAGTIYTVLFSRLIVPGR
jgi:hypothetical protein